MVSETKKKLVSGLVKDINAYPIVGVVNMANLPAQQLQKMRSTLGSRGVKITMARKKLVQLALTESKREGIGDLNKKVKGMPALIFAKDNPFALYSTLQKSKSEAPAKAGQVAPKDIVVKAGSTNFAPGPIISELASVGIKTKVEGGKLAIMADTTVAKEGAVISQKLAETLKRLDVKPMEVGLDLVAVWENGMVYEATLLHIDEAEFARNIASAAQWAINLAVEAAWPTQDTTELLLQKAFRDAKAVGVEGAILTEETRDEILARSERSAQAVKKEANL